MEKLGKVTFFFISLALAVLIGGFSLQIIWGLTIVKGFKVSPITFAQSCSLVLFLAATIKSSKPETEEEKKKPFAEKLIFSILFGIVQQAIFILIAWIISLFL